MTARAEELARMTQDDEDTLDAPTDEPGAAWMRLGARVLAILGLGMGCRGRPALSPECVALGQVSLGPIPPSTTSAVGTGPTLARRSVPPR
jgi:hypothetical protein